MTKFISISLSCFVLLQGLNIHLNDLLDFKVLIDHIEYHESSYGDNFYSFLEKHYGAKKIEHENEDNRKNKEHEKLPFKHNVCLDGPYVFFLNSHVSSRDVDTGALSSSQTFFFQDNYSFLNQDEIFQPPRLS